MTCRSWYVVYGDLPEEIIKGTKGDTMGRHKKFHHRINLRLESELFETLQALALKKGCSIADVCRTILKQNS